MKIGDKVSVERWDKTERVKLGSPAIIIGVSKDRYCQSGTMYLVRGSSGMERELDGDWLCPLDEEGSAQ